MYKTLTVTPNDSWGHQVKGQGHSDTEQFKLLLGNTWALAFKHSSDIDENLNMTPINNLGTEGQSDFDH